MTEPLPPIEGYKYPFRIGDLIIANNGWLMRVVAHTRDTLEDGTVYPVIIIQDPKNLTDFDSITDEEFAQWDTQDAYKTEEEHAVAQARHTAQKALKAEEAAAKMAAFMKQLPSKSEWARMDSDATYEQFLAFNERKYNSRSDHVIIDTLIERRELYLNPSYAVMDLECGSEMPLKMMFYHPDSGRLVFCCDR